MVSVRPVPSFHQDGLDHRKHWAREELQGEMMQRPREVLKGGGDAEMCFICLYA